MPPIRNDFKAVLIAVESELSWYMYAEVNIYGLKSCGHTIVRLRYNVFQACGYQRNDKQNAHVDYLPVPNYKSGSI